MKKTNASEIYKIQITPPSEPPPSPSTTTSDEPQDNWKRMILEEMEKYGDSMDDATVLYIEDVDKRDRWHGQTDEYYTVRGSNLIPNDRRLNQGFDSGYGVAKGAKFSLYTTHRVYFPVIYDGLEWVGSIALDPSEGTAVEHFGGE